MAFSQENTTISQAIDSYLGVVERARSQNTLITYRNTLHFFSLVLEDHEMTPDESRVDQLSEDAIKWLLEATSDYAPATERLYLAAEDLLEINLPQIQELIRNRARRAGKRLPQFPRDDIDKLDIYGNNLKYSSYGVTSGYAQK
jgi:integrase/recombinase XerC